MASRAGLYTCERLPDGSPQTLFGRAECAHDLGLAMLLAVSDAPRVVPSSLWLGAQAIAASPGGLDALRTALSAAAPELMEPFDRFWAEHPPLAWLVLELAELTGGDVEAWVGRAAALQVGPEVVATLRQEKALVRWSERLYYDLSTPPAAERTQALSASGDVVFEALYRHLWALEPGAGEVRAFLDSSRTTWPFEVTCTSAAWLISSVLYGLCDRLGVEDAAGALAWAAGRPRVDRPEVLLPARRCLAALEELDAPCLEEARATMVVIEKVCPAWIAQFEAPFELDEALANLRGLVLSGSYSLLYSRS